MIGGLREADFQTEAGCGQLLLISLLELGLFTVLESVFMCVCVCVHVCA